ncbi:glutamate synthase domain-containing protein 2 [Sphaerotilus mobilis]|uniref:Glutamate synthase domain-containing protein 2 n=1 Tax=Sphaerotilus mobilis TaxID=47994 RepID=A0A4Q7L9V3_9BURK|nr:glutamate synthase domain-containing protein 2 [Sphaerotilus mobilis]
MPAWLLTLDRHVPVRYLMLASCALALAAGLWSDWPLSGQGPSGWTVMGAVLLLIGLHDLAQSRQAVWRHYPVIGHLRFLLAWVRPARGGDIIDSEPDAPPFSRVDLRAEGVSDMRPVGNPQDEKAGGHEWLSHALAPTTVAGHDFRVLIGSAASCRQPYSASVLNVSALRFGPSSAATIEAINGGARQGRFAHETGEGPISEHHRRHGGDLIWAIGSGDVGCHEGNGGFDPQRCAEQAADPQVRMIELQLAHSTFSTPLALMLFVERLRRLSGGKPVGIKLCIGPAWEWFALVKAMQVSRVAPDFIVVDGSEGVTGATPQQRADPTGLPLLEGLQLVHDTLVGVGLRERVRIGCAGEFVNAFDIARAMALGADWCNATPDGRRLHARVVPDTIEQVAACHRHMLEALHELVQAAGLHHPGEFTRSHIVRRRPDGSTAILAECLPPLRSGVLLAAERGEVPWPSPIHARDWPRAQVGSFSPLPMDAVPDDSFGAKHAVAGIAQSRDDVAMVVELPVDRSGVDRHVRVVGMEA